MKKYCLTLDLKDETQSIEAYEKWHQNVWEEIKNSIFDSGIHQMEIYRFHTRLFMIIEADHDFSFEKKAEMDSQNIKVQEWEKLMMEFQEPLKNSKPGEKWVLMNQIFNLERKPEA